MTTAFSGCFERAVWPQTIALLPGSLATDAGDPAICTNRPVNGVDQRGYVRPGTGYTNCSIGAY